VKRKTQNNKISAEFKQGIYDAKELFSSYEISEITFILKKI